MTIKSIDDIPNQELHIDLTGPKGNAFYLLGFATKLAKLLDKDADEITTRMKSSDYENLIEVFEKEFGHFVTLYR